MINSYKNKKGFTLVELLVVIAIIGILSTVAVVNLNQARDKAKIAAALDFVSNYKSAAILCNDSGGQIFLYAVNAPFCCTDRTNVTTCINTDTLPGVSWPDKLPVGYDSFLSFDLNPEDGVWFYVLQDTISGTLPIIVCNEVRGCFMP